MARPRKRLPAYLHHRPRDIGKVRIHGQDFYLPGPYNSPESLEAYGRFVAEYLQTGQPPRTTTPPTGPTVDDLLARFWEEHVARRYVKHDKPTSEQQSFRTALRPVHRLYGTIPVSDFTPLALICCRQALIDAGYTRRRINQHTTRIRRAFRWGVPRGLVPERIWWALKSVDPLSHGEAPDRPRVGTIPEAHIAAIQAHVTPPIWAMIQFQLWTGARPGEVCRIRTCDVLDSDPDLPAEVQGHVWTYRPPTHKTEHHHHGRLILIGPQARAVLEPWLRPDSPQAFIFSPTEARRWFDHRRRAAAKSPARPRPPAIDPKRKPGDRYTVHSYCRAIARATKKVGVPHWHPHQLRHNAATRIRAAYSAEVARIILGHQRLSATEIYAERDILAAVRAVSASG